MGIGEKLRELQVKAKAARETREAQRRAEEQQRYKANKEELKRLKEQESHLKTEKKISKTRERIEFLKAEKQPKATSFGGDVFGGGILGGGKDTFLNDSPFGWSAEEKKPAKKRKASRKSGVNITVNVVEKKRRKSRK